jgi:hypothetical protein
MTKRTWTLIIITVSLSLAVLLWAHDKHEPKQEKVIKKVPEKIVKKVVKKVPEKVPKKIITPSVPLTFEEKINKLIGVIEKVSRSEWKMDMVGDMLTTEINSMEVTITESGNLFLKLTIMSINRKQKKRILKVFSNLRPYFPKNNIEEDLINEVLK